MALTGSLYLSNPLTGTLSQSSDGLTAEVSKQESLSATLSEADDSKVMEGSLSQGSSLLGSLSSSLRTMAASMSTRNNFSGSLSNAALRGYSAYQIAVLVGGYEGTEEEWLLSLKGERIEIQNNNGVLEYKYAGDNTWTILIDLTAYFGDYENLTNRPSLDGRVLSGDKDLSVDYMRNDRALTNLEIEGLLT